MESGGLRTRSESLGADLIFLSCPDLRVGALGPSEPCVHPAPFHVPSLRHNLAVSPLVAPRPLVGRTREVTLPLPLLNWDETSPPRPLPLIGQFELWGRGGWIHLVKLA